MVTDPAPATRLSERRVDVVCEHGGGGHKRGVSGGHDGSRHGPEPDDGHGQRGEVLQHEGQDERVVLLLNGHRAVQPVLRLVPV